MNHRLTATLLASWVLCTSTLAGPLPDPTRPPAAMAGAVAAPSGPHRANLDTARAIAAAARAANPPPPAAAITLQSVQLGSHRPALAMVDGRLVKAGDLVDGRVVLAIDSLGLLLRGEGPRGEANPQRVWLLDGSPKQAAGSIVVNRSARYVPAAAAAHDNTAQHGSPSGNTHDISAERLPSAGPGRGTAHEASPHSAMPASLSLAGRTPP